MASRCCPPPYPPRPPPPRPQQTHATLFRAPQPGDILALYPTQGYRARDLPCPHALPPRPNPSTPYRNRTLQARRGPSNSDDATPAPVSAWGKAVPPTENGKAGFGQTVAGGAWERDA